MNRIMIRYIKKICGFEGGCAFPKICQLNPPKKERKSPNIRQSTKISKSCILARIYGLRQGYKDKSCPGQENKETRT